MKSKGIIYLLFFLCINAYADKGIDINKTTYDLIQVDSIYSNTQIDLQINGAKAVIDWYERKDGLELTNEDFKKLAVSYAVLGDEEKAVTYALKHIKNTHSIDIIYNDGFAKINESTGYKSIVSTYKPKLNGWILFFLSTGLIGVFIAIVLNIRKKEIVLLIF